ncbi:hypothetical protein [Niveispirillum irakense]|uniref:hypothetical protein n=1 Tax=Niveispirillum irakense TaxID=34011 RepID=UPI000423E004|nr:hypothetical protein [Niveispirillum irakense]
MLLRRPYAVAVGLLTLALTGGGALAADGPSAALSTRFTEAVATQSWPLAQVAPSVPEDWSGAKFLILEMKASTSQRFELGLETADGFVSKRIHPLANVWVRASIPLHFFRQGLGDGVDLAATVNKPRDSYWINVEAGGHGPVRKVTGMRLTMRYPVDAPTLEIRAVRLATEDPGDAILDGQPVLDRFGQYARLDWPGKAHDEAGLRQAWQAESANLAQTPAPADRTRYGGFADKRAKATGFFRVEKIDGRWWFVDPEGALFWSAGINGIGPGPSTRIAGRQAMFEGVPPGDKPVSFHRLNLIRRYGDQWQAPWAVDTVRRLRSWGINTTYGTLIADHGAGDAKVPYVITLHGWQTENSIMGMPDVYSPVFEQRVDRIAAEQLAPRRDDPWLLGYFIGNEPPWPAREAQLVDMVLAGPPSALQQRFRDGLKQGDTPEKRRELVLAAFARYLEVINKAVKRHDPHHLNLGIRFGGTPPMDVVRLAKDFDVYSMNKYRWAPPTDMLDEIATDLKLPILIGEFHIGVPERGLAPGLVQAMNQQERAQAYRYYVENAAAHSFVVGTHWFQWVDQPATGRSDGENYNIGWVDVTDQPYPALVAASKEIAGRVAGIHAGTLAPTDRRAAASQAGTPADSINLGVPAIQ